MIFFSEWPNHSIIGSLAPSYFVPGIGEQPSFLMVKSNSTKQDPVLSKITYLGNKIAYQNQNQI
jgi:hypothetical protein